MPRKLIVVSNRGPFRTVEVAGKPRLVRAAGGLVAALDPVLRSRGGVWVSAKQAAQSDLMADLAASDHPYQVVTVPLSKSDTDEFYSGISNALIWPILHSMPPTVRISPAPWRAYEKANEAFAQAVLSSSSLTDLIWIQDYHLMLMPGILRAARERARIGWFCHIPWPGVELFRIVPWHRQILEGLLGADLLGFHTEGYANNFLACVAELDGVQVDFARKTARLPTGRTVRLVVAPIGVPWDELQTLAADPRVTAYAEHIRQSLGRRILLGVDRLDYTKGIPQRLLAFEQLLRADRSARNRFAFVQIMVPSRTDVQAYADLKQEIDRLVGDINGSYGRAGRIPVQYMYRNIPQDKLLAHYLAADVSLVTPLRDGMNLVSMEYCAARVRGGGVLVLSEFAGAAEYLREGALVVNPYDIHHLSGTIQRALDMDEAEANERMMSLRSAVHKLDVHRWADEYLYMLERP